jgi:putative ABC transport system permease protein
LPTQRIGKGAGALYCFPIKLTGKPASVGAALRVGRLRLRVVGVLAAKGHNLLGADEDDQLFLPLPVLEHRLAGKEDLAMILASARTEGLRPRAEKEITRLLRNRHRLKAGAANNFDVSSVQEMAQLAIVFTGTMQVLVGILASIALLVGGIGIMNIMLVSVTERNHEIGIRLAVGATPADVMLQFLLESLLLALAGGVAGMAIGIAVALALARLAGWPVVLTPEGILVAVGIAAAVGINFGYYPAWKASRQEPIKALHHE